MPLQSVRHLPGKVYGYDLLDAPWVPTGRPGLQQKVVRGDRERGLFLGLLGFDPLTRTGLHQHQAPALSYVLDGSLYDYDGPVVQGQVGINLKGATHDAVAYNRCLLAARLEGPVHYRPEDGADGRVHTGSREAKIVNRAPEVPPDINISLEGLPSLATTLAGVSRRLVFDYRGTGTDRRMAQLALLPGTRIPVHATTAPVDWFLLAGDATVNGDGADRRQLRGDRAGHRMPRRDRIRRAAAGLGGGADRMGGRRGAAGSVRVLSGVTRRPAIAWRGRRACRASRRARCVPPP